MKHLFMLLIFVACSLTSNAQEQVYKYRIYLTDKQGSSFELNNPITFLSPKAIERRAKQGLSVDESDLPVSKLYVKKIEKLGFKIILTGKWENFVTISTNKRERIKKVKKLPFVKDVKLVWQGAEMPETTSRMKVKNCLDRRKDCYYGAFQEAIALTNVDKLHDKGFSGEGMTIAVIDAGYQNMDVIESMSNINVLGTKNFVTADENVFEYHSHGLSVLSCMAMNRPYYMVGTAPKASYWLLKSEDVASESLIEQDYWTAAIEFADSVGVDLVNTSLGYNVFNNSEDNYRLRDLDGARSLISRQASKVADKGIVLVCSAGNTGADSWKKITVPADAFNVITVGAVDKDGVLATFSAVGNTADGRVKPDVVAIGVDLNVMYPDGTINEINGTSFASPTICGMVACLWQSLPQLTAKQIINLVRSTGDRSDYPDNIYGYGIPNFWKAYLKQINADYGE